MHYETKRRSTWLALLIFCLSTQLASAGKVYIKAEAPAVPDSMVEILNLGETVPPEELSSISGRQNIDVDEIDIQMSEMQVDSKMGGNVLYSNSTGGNTVTNDAFSNASGIATVIQNSGNQVIINNALILNVNVE